MLCTLPRPFVGAWLAPVFFAAPAHLAPTSAAAVQESPVRAPNVFFDCNGPNCDDDYYRTEIPWVNWVRDRQDADVHVIVTSQSTGAGGREYRIDLTGREQAEDYQDEVTYATLPTDTDREELDGIAYTLEIALARFANQNGFPTLVDVEGLEVAGVDPAASVVAPGQVDDPWNLWVFRINGSADLDGEDTREETELRTSASASRVTPTWKLDYDGSVTFNKREIETSDSTTFVDERTDWSLDALQVYGIAEHWSVGLDINSGRLTRFNQDFRIEVRPAVEYSYFPYEEATRRALTAFYEIGPTYRNYQDTTLFGKIEETRFEHSLELEFSQRQTWGDASVSGTFSHFLDDFEQRNFRLNGNVDFRITRGFSINGRGSASWVNDQIFLAAGDRTPEEILLRLAQQQTDFSWNFRVGFSFQFGSIFNNVVNNRFGGGGFGGFRR